MGKTLTGYARLHRAERVENHRARRRWSKKNEGTRLRTLKSWVEDRPPAPPPPPAGDDGEDEATAA